MIESPPVCSAIESALTVFGRAWAAAVLDALLQGATRFSEIKALVPAATDTMLSRRLKELCGADLVRREVLPGPPTVISYHLTATGEDARPVLDALRAYGRRHPV
ncbi:winged helix-turn-helix transcriptional regulator [Propionicicella superfundia]|uniref:winged helix-turn-helix transcriptional regulator n=1 Tax=Propionicicella superfundia TaxID=348582 RepID=UPI00041BDC11|nr:helix-turn-helix domain-containing protein [Propionicicella superfundia]